MQNGSTGFDARFDMCLERLDSTRLYEKRSARLPGRCEGCLSEYQLPYVLLWTNLSPYYLRATSVIPFHALAESLFVTHVLLLH